MAPETARLFDFLPLTIRIETKGGVATPLVLRGTPLPAKRSDVFSTAEDNQISVEVKLLLGESPLVRNNIELGKFHLKGLPPAKQGKPQIQVEFSVDKTCAVVARAMLQGTEYVAEEKLHPTQELSEEFIQKMLANAEFARASDEAELLRIEATNEANSLISKAEIELKKGPNLKLNEAIAAVGLALASGESDRIREKSDVLKKLLNQPSQAFEFTFDDLFPTVKTVKTTPRQPSPTRSTSRQQGLAFTPPPQALGRIFGGGSFTLDPQLCFVLMPFTATLQPLYEDHIRPIIQKAGLRCERADEIRGTTMITWDVWERINRARILVCELTGQNPNVFYELGLAHALGKETILITQSMDFVPFDLKTIRCIVYDFTPRGTQKLEEALRATVGALIKSA